MCKLLVALSLPRFKSHPIRLFHKFPTCRFVSDASSSSVQLYKSFRAEVPLLKTSRTPWLLHFFRLVGAPWFAFWNAASLETFLPLKHPHGDVIEKFMTMSGAKQISLAAEQRALQTWTQPCNLGKLRAPCRNPSAEPIRKNRYTTSLPASATGFDYLHTTNPDYGQSAEAACSKVTIGCLAATP